MGEAGGGGGGADACTAVLRVALRQCAGFGRRAARALALTTTASSPSVIASSSLTTRECKGTESSCVASPVKGLPPMELEPRTGEREQSRGESVKTGERTL